MEKTLGLIIIFYNDEHRLNLDAFIKLRNYKKSCSLCLVNNGSDDQTLKRLYELKHLYEDQVGVLDIKKHKPLNAALKAGIRYLKSHKDYQLIGFIDSNDILNFEDFINWVETFSFKESKWKEILMVIDKKSSYMRNLLRNVYSIKDLKTNMEIK
ncbi:MAG: glycosyltransferase [Bacteroidia bacterium]|nr:glycosyltransferase [Bacteroidia bacterium]NND24774.1 glycosyltransferase [Flavobacteriaceae bacterium]NNM35651.1 glycosyltransferase [Nitrosopumilus sp.]MBT8279189.1 glycosyltransferase [Bacteroidia bacterium]NNK60877.1 glycosyltransferase [Flavobacteriaceae bacterium]